MMKTYKLVPLLILVASFIMACSQDDMELNKGNIPLEIAASSARVDLDAINPNLEALKYIWTSGSNFGTNSAISYTFQLDVKGNNFAGGISLEMGRGIYEISYKNEELNEILINDFGIAPNTEVNLESRIIAKISHTGMNDEVSNVATVTVKTHTPITKTLYIIGSAAPNGWSSDNASEMKAVTNTPKAFTWTGKLSAGEFKFITTLGQFTPSYNKGDSDTKLYFRESDSDPYDDKFKVEVAGTYTIKVNLITMVISIVRGEGPEYTELWFVGHSSDWNFKAMTVDPLDPFVFHYNADLSKGGEFKIGTAAGSWDAAFLRPKVNNTSSGKNLDVVKWAGDPDNKWNITGGVYKIKLDTKEMKIDIVPFTPYTMIYLVGSATPNGWDIGNATPMTPTSDPYKFTWTGNLGTGEMKFTLDKQSDWNGAWFLANEADKTPKGEVEQMLYNYPGAGVDFKWSIKEAGTYSIELDQLKETVIIRKQ